MTQTAIGHHYEAEYDIAKKVVDNFIKNISIMQAYSQIFLRIFAHRNNIIIERCAGVV